jgi:uncharacterized protein
MFRKIICLVLVSGGLTAFEALPALAASFDCAKAATPFEQAICGDADLSRADERLAKSYATAIGGLSEIALGEMRTSQRDWLDYARRACTRDATELTSGSYDERGVSCLIDVFNSRSRVLETSRMMEGIRFYPLASYATQIDPYEVENPDSSWPVAQHEMALVQIDADEGFAHAFNDLVRAEGDLISGVFAPQGGSERIEDDSSSDSTNIILVDDIAGRNLISLLVNTYWYGHGAAHGNYTISFRHFLKEQGRFLEARDMFAGKGWEKALLNLAVEAATAEHGDNLMLEDTKYIAESVIDPSRWNLSDPYGLIIQFQPYEISAYAYGAPTALIRWDDLEPYLAENADQVRRGW